MGWHHPSFPTRMREVLGQQPSSISNYSLPPEVILMVAKHFRRTTLRVALQVCKDLNGVSRDLIWYEVFEIDWHHSSFPTRAPRFQLQDMATRFAHTRKMAWHSNKALAQRRTTTAPFLLSTQITPVYLTRIFSLMTNLTSVELHVDARPAISTFDNLRGLKNLELDLLSCTTPRFSVRLLASLFSRINCLKLVMPLETMVISMEDLPETGPWEITELDIEPEAIPLSARWPESFASLSDHVAVLTLITGLRSLEVAVRFPDEIEFDQSAVDPPLPSLQEIIFKNTRGDDYTNNLNFCRICFSILRTRTDLKIFCEEGCTVNPLVVFPGWACDNLEELRLNLLWPESSVFSADEMDRCWTKVCRQIGKLEHLKTLSIETKHLGYYPAIGFLQDCKPLLYLQSLALASPETSHSWRKDQFRSLLERYPSLRHINLGGLMSLSMSKIQEVLDEQLVRRIEFTSFGRNLDGASDGSDGLPESHEEGEHKADEYEDE